MKNVDLKDFKNIHFLGIGGIGVSAVAKMFYLEGKKVSGSDLSTSPVIESLEKIGISVNLGHKESNLGNDVDLVVYSVAVSDDNSEILKAKNLDIPTISYPEVLGLISSDKYTIAVSGTHGKTTTTAMISKILSDANLSPTVIVGSLLKENKSNFIKGNSDIFVAEACEYKESFLNLEPHILVITNIDNDHLDHYGSMENIISSFKQMAGRVKKGGFLITDLNDENAKEVASVFSGKVINYSELNRNLNLEILGEHNKKNAKAAISTASILKVLEEDSIKSLNSFKGTWRRLEKKGVSKRGAVVYDDYAHHPTEIKATLSALREAFPKKKIILIFQPHLFSRTKILMKDFSESFDLSDEVILLPIYKAREKEDKEVSSEILLEKIKSQKISSSLFYNFNDVVDYLSKNTSEDNIIVTMGAGDVYKIGEKFLNL